MKRKKFSVRLDDNVLELIDLRAKQEGRSRSNMVNRLMADVLNASAGMVDDVTQHRLKQQQLRQRRLKQNSKVEEAG